MTKKESRILVCPYCSILMHPGHDEATLGIPWCLDMMQKLRVESDIVMGPVPVQWSGWMSAMVLQNKASSGMTGRVVVTCHKN